jgi:hypothetical protein
MRAHLHLVEEIFVGHQAHAQSHADHDHVEGHAVEKSENGCADAGSAIALITVVILTALFWLAGHAG